MIEFAVLVMLVIMVAKKSFDPVAQSAGDQFCRGGFALAYTSDVSKVYYKVSTKQCCVRSDDLGGDQCFGGTGF